MSFSFEEQSSMIEDPVAASLDNEIATLQEQIATLKSQRALQASTILSSHNTLNTLNSIRNAQSSYLSKAPSKSTKPSTVTPQSTESDISPLITRTALQSSHNITNLYRTLSSITTFHITDPDPNAVDSGHVLGLRFDVSTSNGRFIKPYYVMLNRPFGVGEEGGSEETKGLYRVHRHTLPPCIPLAYLAKRWLPTGKVVLATGGTGNQGVKKQDLKAFVRGVRREIMGYHQRLWSIKNLRKDFGIDEISKKGKGREKVIVDVTTADAEAKQVRIEWVDGRIGRIAIDERGVVKKCVIIGEEGRDRLIEKRILEKRAGKDSRIEDVADRLKEGIY